jgi:2-C-methyl-D-erythritol 4-phosphate cytidylyltransferase
MKEPFEVGAIIPAAGSGRRMNATVNKIMLPLLGRSVLEHTLEVVLNSDLIKILVLAVKAEEKEVIENLITTVNLKYGNEIVMVEGGEERQESVAHCLEYLRRWNGWNSRKRLVAIHDAARPLLSPELLRQSLMAGLEYGAVGIGVPIKDTIKQVDSEGMIIATPDRSSLWGIQTPQVFELDLLLKCYEKAKTSGLLFTDDCGVVEYCGFPVKLIPGSYENFKITTPEDLILAEAILRRRTDADRPGV